MKKINLNPYLIEEKLLIKDALKKIDKNKKRFLLVVDENEKLLGTLTDGDIRRALLKGLSLEDSLSDIVKKEFVYLKAENSFQIICEKFKNSKIDFLPIVDCEFKLINVLTKQQFHILLLENISFSLMYDFTKLDKKVLEHEIYNRPWGFYKSTILTSHSQAKIITIFPNSELSLQEHKKREEHWVILKGKGKMILGESILDIYSGKYIYIPKGCKHQIINNSNKNIVLSEVQLGEYFGEDDIIRHKDKYNRK